MRLTSNTGRSEWLPRTGHLNKSILWQEQKWSQTQKRQLERVGVLMAGGREGQGARKGNGVKQLRQIGAEMV